MPTYILRSDASFQQFDATTQIGFQHAAAVTSHPIEDGSEVSDHVQRLPDVITVTGIVSGSALQGSVGSDDPNRERTAKDFFNAIVGERVIVVTQRDGAFSGYALRRWTWAIDVVKRTVFDLEFVLLTLAESSAVIIDTSVEQVSSGFSAASDSGEQPTTSTAAAPAAAAADASLLYSLLNGS